MSESLNYYCSSLGINTFNGSLYANAMCVNKLPNSTIEWSMIIYNISNQSFTGYLLPGLVQYTSVLFINPMAYYIIDSSLAPNPASVAPFAARLYLMTPNISVANNANNIIQGQCGLPARFDAIAGRLLWNSYNTSLIGLALLDAFGNGLAIISLNSAGGYACSQGTASVINIAGSLLAQNGFIPNNAIYNNFAVLYSSSNSNVSISNYTILLNAGNAPFFQFTISVNFATPNAP